MFRALVSQASKLRLYIGCIPRIEPLPLNAFQEEKEAVSITITPRRLPDVSASIPSCQKQFFSTTIETNKQQAAVLARLSVG
jgi:hypothetical protein